MKNGRPWPTMADVRHDALRDMKGTAAEITKEEIQGQVTAPTAIDEAKEEMEAKVTRRMAHVFFGILPR